MSSKIYIPEGEEAPQSQIGATLEALAATISARKDAGEESYTYRLMQDDRDLLVKKVMEEAGETALAAKDADQLMGSVRAHEGLAGMSESSMQAMEARVDSALDHLRYEAADVVYHLLVLLEKYEIGIDEFAAELNSRMTADERPRGGALVREEHVNRG